MRESPTLTLRVATSIVALASIACTSLNAHAQERLGRSTNSLFATGVVTSRATSLNGFNDAFEALSATIFPAASYSPRPRSAGIFAGTWKTSISRRRDTCPGQGPSTVRTRIQIDKAQFGKDLVDNTVLSTGVVDRRNRILFNRTSESDGCTFSQSVAMTVSGRQASVRVKSDVECNDGLSCYRLYTGTARR